MTNQSEHEVVAIQSDGPAAAPDEPLLPLGGDPLAGDETGVLAGGGGLAELDAREVTAWFGGHMVLAPPVRQESPLLRAAGAM